MDKLKIFDLNNIIIIYKIAFWKYGRWLVETSKQPCLYNSIQTRGFLRLSGGFHGNFKQNKIVENTVGFVLNT